MMAKTKAGPITIFVRISIICVTAVILAAIWIWTSFLPPSPLGVPAPGLLLTDVTIINPGRDRTPNAALTVEGEVITSIGSAPTNAGGQGPYAGHYVLPGLIDMHVHHAAARVKLTEYFALLFLAHGVTSVRDAGDTDGTALEPARGGIETLQFPGPRIFASGPFVDIDAVRWANTRLLSDPEDARRAVTELKSQGFDFVKAYDHLTTELLAVLKEAADEEGLGVFGHVPIDLSYEQALLPDAQHFYGIPGPELLESGSMKDRIASWKGVDEARLQVIVDTATAHGLANTPTLVSKAQLLKLGNYEATLSEPEAAILPRFFSEIIWSPVEGIPFYRELDAQDYADLADQVEKMKTLAKMLHEAGAQLYAGSDTLQPFVAPGDALQRELKLLVEAGISAEDVWQIATADSGKALGQEKLGVIEAGAPADLLIFSEDPTADIDALDSLQAVVARGRLYTKTELDDALKTLQDHYAGPVYDRITQSAARKLIKTTIKE